MIDNIIKTNLIQNNPQQNNNAKQLSNIQTTISQLQSAPGFQSKTASSPLLKNLLQLIKNIIEQLKQEPKEQSKPKPPEQSKPSQPENEIKGTEGDDNLNGSRKNERMFGLGGNDSIKGRQGNDFLDGGAGRDKLYGGQGDDTLSGGKGNDYLSGGSGNNRLFGGEGDDTLASRRGTNDFLDGGSGTDTARVRGNIDDYSLQTITVFPQGINPGDIVPQGAPIDNGIKLTHKTTGQTITVTNIEKFRFNDARLSFDEMKQRAPEQEEPKPLDISSIPKNKLLALFENQGIPGVANSVSILDSNKDGKLSAGDVAVLSGGFTGGEITRKTLSEADIQKLTDTTPSDAQKALDNNSQKWADSGIKNYNYDFQRSCFCLPDYTRPIKTEVENGDVKSSNYADGDREVVSDEFTENKQSVNGLFDTIQKAIDNGRQVEVTYDSKTGMPTKIVIDRDQMPVDGGQTITAGNLQNLDKPNTKIILTGDQDSALKERFDISHSDSYSIADKDGNTKLSVGDELSIKRKVYYADRAFGVGETRPDQPAFVTKVITLSAEDINAINSKPFPLELNLNKKQHDAIGARFNRLPPPGTADFPTTTYEGVATDKDGDGVLSVGDTVKLKSSGGFRIGGDTISEHVLTQADLDAINKDTSNPLLDISTGLSADQHQRLTRTLGLHGATGDFSIGIKSVFDGNSDGKLSVGDTVIIERNNAATGDPVADQSQISFHTLTQTDIDRFLSDNPANKEPALDGTSWQLQRVGSDAPHNNHHSNLSFNGSQIDYNDGVNNHSGSFNSNQSGSFSLGNVVGTKIGSDDETLANAEAINQGLSSASRYDISDDGKTLTFFNDSDQVTLIYSKENPPAEKTEITPTDSQDNAIRIRFNIGNNDLNTPPYSITDKDQSKTLSVGDEITISRGSAAEVITLTSDDISAINPSFTLEDRLSYLDNKNFVSEELLEVGIGGDGLVLGHWNIQFGDGEFNWAYSDVGEAGKYNISGNDISLTRFDDSQSAFKIFPEQHAIEIDGHRYIHTLSENIVDPAPEGNDLSDFVTIR